MSDTSAAKGLIAGACGGINVVLIGHPLDTLKVRLQHQSHDNPEFKGFTDCIVKTFKNEGYKGFYKGMGTPLLGVTPIIALSFGGYNFGKNLQKSEKTEILNLKQIYFAGMMSGVFTMPIVIPADRIKCLLQIQSNSQVKLYKGPIDCAKKIFQREGFKGLFKGGTFTFLRDGPGSGVFYLTYELILRNWISEGQKREDAGFMKILLAGGISGSAFWFTSIVPDVLKTRLQTAPDGTYSGLIDVFKKTINQGGVKSLFRGLTPVMIRSFPTNAACFLGYEGALKVMNHFSP